MTESVLAEAVSLASLPAIKQPLADGVFCGVVTMPDGKPYAVAKLDAKPPKRMKWQTAMDWAKSVGGQLPSRVIAALLFSLAQDLFEPVWHWTCEPEGSSFAWNCLFNFGNQYYDDRSFECCAVAVRLIPLTA